jgi:UDP-N-acetylmuramyl-tripeptide synthetase
MKNLLKKFIPDFLLGWYHFSLALVGAIIYRFPAKRLKIIGVTGTNGKSSVVFLISQILEKAGYQVASLSSIQFKIKNKTWVNDLKMTMPGRTKLQGFLHRAKKAGCQYVVLEITSEGIVQHRHRFIGFDAAVLTNLTREHLESHGGFENYKRAKGKLFQSLKSGGRAIVNLDDRNADYFLQFKASQKIGYGLDFQFSDQVDKFIKATNYQFSRKGMIFSIDKTDFKLNLLGRFNLYNVLAAISVMVSEGISLEDIKTGLESVEGIPGRLEIVVKEPFTVIVDYAHTPDALEKVYQTVKEVFSGRLVGVLGAAGGGRDRWKRSELGRIAERYLDKIIITNEDPYDEDPQEIIEQVAAGLTQKEPEKILERRKAIRRALKAAQPGDLVVITGKGCEPWMCVANNKKIPWDDRKLVKEEFADLSGGT